MFPSLVFSSVKRVKCLEMSELSTVLIIRVLVSCYRLYSRFSIMLLFGYVYIITKLAAM